MPPLRHLRSLHGQGQLYLCLLNGPVGSCVEGYMQPTDTYTFSHACYGLIHEFTAWLRKEVYY